MQDKYDKNNIIKWGPKAKIILNSLRDKSERLKELSIVTRKYNYNALPTMKEIQSSGRIKLKRFDNGLNYLIAVHGIQIGHMQQKLFDAIRISLFPIMFGDELIRNISYLKRIYDFVESYDMFAGLYPRREGKTVIVSIIAAIMMVTQPDGNVICYNIGKRQSDEWMDLVKRYLMMFKDSEEFGWTEVAISGKEKYTIKSKLSGTENNAYAYGCGQTHGKISYVFN